MNTKITQWQEFQLARQAVTDPPTPPNSDDIDGPEWTAYFRGCEERDQVIANRLGFSCPHLNADEFESQREWVRSNLLLTDAVDGFDDRFSKGVDQMRERESRFPR